MSVLPYRLRKLVAVRPGVKAYEGEHLSDRRAALILHLHPHASAGDPEGRFERFDTWAARLATLDHPSLPRHRFRTRRAEEPLYLVTDLPHGTPLDTLLDETGALPWYVAVRLLRPVAGALAHAHAAGVLHLGLRPDRVLVRRREPAVLCDVGLTPHFLEDADEPLRIDQREWTSLFPRPEMVAPELIRRRTPGAAADVHGLGVLLFHATTLAWPYDAGTSVLVYNQVRAGIRPESLEKPLAHAPAAFVQLIAQATACEPGDRFADVAALVAALDALPVPVDEAAAGLAAVQKRATDEPYTSRFAEILTVVDGGRAGGWRPPGGEREEEVAESEAEAPDEALLAAQAEERERQLRLADLALEQMRTPRRTRSRRRAATWLVLGLFVAGAILLLPYLVDSQRVVRRHPGGPDPVSGLTHGAPPPPPEAGRIRAARGRETGLGPHRRAPLRGEDRRLRFAPEP